MAEYRGILKPIFRASLLLFFLLSFCVNSCASGNVQGDFYKALKNNSVSSFEKSISSPNIYIRQAASEKLADLSFEGRKLSAKTEERIRREVSGAWAAAFNLTANEIGKEKALAFLLGFEHGRDSNKARLHVLQECEKRGNFFNEAELAIIEGHFAVSGSRYGEGLNFFRELREDEKWPERIPPLFLVYPHLINDLGRAFQYTSTGEGVDLFLQWEKSLNDFSTANAPSAVAQLERNLRYRLLFYAGRIARRVGRTEQALSVFEEARSFAPDAEQTDACIWYILDLSVSAERDVFIQRLEQLIPHWDKDNYYDDILEKFLTELISKREWEKIIRTFGLIQNRTPDSVAGYSWIIARAIEEGLLNEEETRIAAETVNVPVTALNASVYMCIAYNARDTSLFYRSQSAAKLGVPVLELPSAEKNEKTSGKLSEVMQFLLGFFYHSAGQFAMPYIRLFEKELTPAELRLLAEAYDKAGMYIQSIRLVNLYIDMEGYTPERRDMELFFPNPYKEFIEKSAAEYSISPSLIYGLVRTESAFQSDIISRVGAVGLTQLMPATAQEMANNIRRAGGPDYSKELDLNDPAMNIHIGSYYLNYLIGRFNDNLLAILAYNGGMNRVRRWHAGNTLPVDIFMETVSVSETRGYGKKVMAASAVYEELYYHRR